MRRSIRILIALVGLLVVVVVVVAIVVANYDWNKQKPWVTAKVSGALNRTVTIDGDLQVHWERDPSLHGISAWIPGPRVSASKVTVGNPEWAKSRNFATVDRVEFDLSIWPLLTHTISIPAVRFVDPDVDIERVSDKKNNWTFGTTDDNGDAKSSWKFDVGRVRFARGKIAIVDRVKQLDARINVDSLHESIPFDELVAQQETASRKEAAERVGTAGAKNDRRRKK